MKAYLSFFRIRFLAGLQYRTAAWAGIATQFAWGGMNLLMYAAFYKTGADAFPMEFAALSDYIWLQQAFLALFMTWYFDGEILDAVVTGSVAYELCRPGRPVCDVVRQGTGRAHLKGVWLASRPFCWSRCFCRRLTASDCRWSACRAAVRVFYGAGTLRHCRTVDADLYFGVLYGFTAWRSCACRNTDGIFRRRCVALPFFPDALRTILYALPFASIQNTPFLIYTGHLRSREALLSSLLQAVWLVLLVALGRFWMRRAIRRTVVQGG